MYLPGSFREIDTATIHEFIEQHNFALLVSRGSEGLEASHLPVLLRRDAGPFGCLFGHMARANPQWRRAEGEVMVVFSGPHAYVSPSWYESKAAVPTWNYVAVHAYGALELVEDSEPLREILRASVALFEGSRPKPWVFDESSDYVNSLVGSIVGFRIAINRLEGKWKLNQNRSEADRQRVAETLSDHADDDARAIGKLMAERL
jgi:transcriptional regulator